MSAKTLNELEKLFISLTTILSSLRHLFYVLRLDSIYLNPFVHPVIPDSFLFFYTLHTLHAEFIRFLRMLFRLSTLRQSHLIGYLIWSNNKEFVIFIYNHCVISSIFSHVLSIVLRFHCDFFLLFANILLLSNFLYCIVRYTLLNDRMSLI